MLYTGSGLTYKNRIIAFTILCAFIFGMAAALLPLGLTTRLLVLLGSIGAVFLAWAYRQPKSNVGDQFSFLILVCVVSLSIVWPRYIFFHFPGMPGINPYTLCIFVALFLNLVLLAHSQIHWSEFRESYTQGGVITKLFACWVTWVFICAAIGEEPIYSVIEAAKDAIYLTSFILFGLWLSRRDYGPLLVYRCFLFFGFFVVVAGVVESFTFFNYFTQFASMEGSISSQQALQSIVADKARGGNYRVQSVFDHPIVFAQFVAAIIPLAVFSIAKEKKLFWRLLAASIVPLAILAIGKSGSRSGYFSLAAAFGCMGLMWWFKAVNRGYISRAVAILSLPLLLVAGIFAYIILGELFAGRSQHEISSTNTRLTMLANGWHSLLESPIFGYGHGMAIEKAGVVNVAGLATIDNYLLSISLDAGLVGFLIFISIPIIYSLKAIRFSITQNTTEGAFIAACCASLLALLVTFTGLSITQNMSMYWLLITISLPIFSGGKIFSEIGKSYK